ncbi:acetylcholinesterase [Podospora aff. communis PSN243]|uniref:Acetylcholinesterase n=1 Tax=Podospora aff. communis PSN243 TaxID=3040156 RepID=A0AAV9G5R4_9PEZI|nr:acetylcholinesterase [Podospora aff. communis PSN243]
MQPNPLILIVAFSLTALVSAAPKYDSGTVVRTANGVIRGTVDSATPAVRQFLGIPYSKPPLGDLRFAPPQKALSFGEMNATETPPSCMQYIGGLPNIIINDVLEFNIGSSNASDPLHISEDCLTLSVWAPRNPKEKDLPVIVFFYGGAFLNGGTDVPYQIPAQWIQRTQNLIVVTFNHRGNIFGYPNTAGLPLGEQNVGLLDQRMAIEWLRDNIAAFGGDSNRIGAWGESSGAVAMAYYSYTYRDDPILNSLIMDSGNEFIDILTKDPTHANFTFMAEQFGCGDLDPGAELSCMRQVNASAMQDFMRAYSDDGKVPIITFSPVVDNRTVFANYTKLEEEGKLGRLPVLIGSNAQDGEIFVPYDPNGVDTALADLITMTWFFCPSYQSAKVRTTAKSGPVYRYLYAGNFSNISPRPWMGAWHGAELPLVFGTHSLYRGNSTQLEYETSYAMQDAWLAFVATAGKKPSIEGWDAWDAVDGGRVVEFGNGVAARLIDTTQMEVECSTLPSPFG